MRMCAYTHEMPGPILPSVNLECLWEKVCVWISFGHLSQQPMRDEKLEPWSDRFWWEQVGHKSTFTNKKKPVPQIGRAKLVRTNGKT